MNVLADEMLDLERQILDAHQRHDAVAIARFLAHGFREIGSSGRTYTRADVLAAVGRVELLDYALQQPTAMLLGEDRILLTFVATLKRRQGAHERAQRSHRSSIWIKHDGRWQVIFHQGTPIS